MSNLTLKCPVKVNQDQRSSCTFINWAMLNICVHMHLGSRSNRLDDTRHFHFRDLEMTSSRSSKVKFLCGFWKANIDFPIVSHSNHGSTSHRLATIHDCNRRQTDDRQHSSNTDSWLASHESAKMFTIAQVVNVHHDLCP